MDDVVLDACILFQGKLTDFLLCIAEADAFAPIWSHEIHKEWMRNLERRFGLPREKIQYRRDQMEIAFPVANCPADPAELNRVLSMCTTDDERKDAHVIATAITAQAAIIVTDNFKHFPNRTLKPNGLRKLKPDTFCANLLKFRPDYVVNGAKRHRESMKFPPYDAQSYLRVLASNKVGLPRTAALLSGRIAAARAFA